MKIIFNRKINKIKKIVYNKIKIFYKIVKFKGRIKQIMKQKKMKLKTSKIIQKKIQKIFKKK